MKQAITRKWLRVRISARLARAMIFCFHYKLSIEYGNKQRKLATVVNYFKRDGQNIFCEIQ